MVDMRLSRLDQDETPMRNNDLAFAEHAAVLLSDRNDKLETVMDMLGEIFFPLRNDLLEIMQGK